MINRNKRLCDIFLNFSFIIRVLFLLLDVVHGEFKLVDDGLVEDFVYKAVGLGQVVLEV